MENQQISIQILSELLANALAAELTGASPSMEGPDDGGLPPLTWYRCDFASQTQIQMFVGVPEGLEGISVVALPNAFAELGRKLSERTGLDVSGSALSPGEPAEECEQARVTVAAEGSHGEIVLAVPPATLAALEAAPPVRQPRSEPNPSVKPKYLEFLMGLDLPMKISFGTSTLPLSEILRLSVGSMVELNRRYTDPVDIVVNDRLIARGEVVDVDGNYGVRVLEVCDWP